MFTSFIAIQEPASMRPILVFRVNTIKRIPSRVDNKYLQCMGIEPFWNNENDLCWLNNPGPCDFSPGFNRLWARTLHSMGCDCGVAGRMNEVVGWSDLTLWLFNGIWEASTRKTVGIRSPTFRKCHIAHNCSKLLARRRLVRAFDIHCALGLEAATLPSPERRRGGDDNCRWLFDNESRQDTLLYIKPECVGLHLQ